MKIIRAITAVLAALVVLSLAGCSNPGDPADARIDDASAAVYAHIDDAHQARDCMVLYRMHATYPSPYAEYALSRVGDLGCLASYLYGF